MSPFQYFIHILRVMKEISQRTGYSTLYLFCRFVSLYVGHRVGIAEFRSLRLYEYTRRKSTEFLMWRDSCRIADRLNTGATKADLDTFEEKHLFNAVMKDFIHRDWLYLPEASDEEVAAFLAHNPVFLVKPSDATQGEGIVKYESEEMTPERLRREQPGSVVIEGFIRQHPALAAVNPSSVNTIRYIAARREDEVVPIGAGLRVGGSGQFVDNFHHGGIAYPLDLETGVITGAGIDLEGNRILCHPTTGHIMPGMQIPYWDELKEMVRRAAVIVPHVGYVGWDIAITPEGPDLVEGNAQYPGNTVIQIDGPGPRGRLKAFMAAAPKH